jgi:hypothetical protein
MTRATEPCGLCAARQAGKPWGIAKNMTRAQGNRHVCGATLSSAYILSWHSTREAAAKARLAYRREHRGARVWYVHSHHPAST